LPGGGVRHDETPGEAARRELAEEIGLTAAALLPLGVACTNCDGRYARTHFFELRLVEPPKLRLDNREVIEARLVSPFELQNMALTRSVAAYLARGAGVAPLDRETFDDVALYIFGSIRPRQRHRAAV
jgi:ADP-ribose pyrophosphatase YjhB (NUDIX family)